MSSYYDSFSYLGKNSLQDQNLIIVSFEPDDGFTDSFLSMDNISDDYFDGTKTFNYGSKYNTTAEIQITMIKADGSDIKLNEFRSLAKWLTGARIDSYLDMYVGDTVIYSFFGKFINLEQYKFDARTVGIRMTFSSVSPWAYSAPQIFTIFIEQSVRVTDDGVLVKQDQNDTYISGGNETLLIEDNLNKIAYSYNDENLTIESLSEDIVLSCEDGIVTINSVTNDGVFGFKDGIVFLNPSDEGSCFYIDDDGTISVDDVYRTIIDNQSDDLYTYIYLDIVYNNRRGDTFYINNVTTQDTTKVSGLIAGETVSISAKQFIISDIPNKIFGDNFNFVWPRLAPGENELTMTCGGNGSMTFTYRYPMKVGDCTMDIDVYGSNINCGNCPDDDRTVFTGTIAWSNITDTPDTIDGYGITDAYTTAEIDNKIDNLEINGGTGAVNIDEEKLNDMLLEILQ